MQTQTKIAIIPKFRKIERNNLMLDEIDKALEVSMYYGFTPIKRPIVSRSDLESTKSFENQICNKKIDDDLERCHRLDNKVGILRSYVEGNFKSLPHPLMLSFRDKQRSTDANTLLNLSIIGTQSSIAEAVAIKTSLAILSEQNYKDLSVEVNSIGDRDSFSKFEKEIMCHVKKSFDSIPKHLSGVVKKNFKQVLEEYSKEEASNELWANAPKPTSYLNSSSIKHFQEVLQFLENLEIPYNLNHFLIPDKDFCHHTVFQIRNSGVLVALGVRHQNVVKKLSLRKEIPFLTVALRDGLCLSRKIKIQKIKPKFFLVQFGNKAKIKSLIVIEQLRKVGIPIYHLLTKDKLVGQLSMAESLNFSYLILIGEKEAVENS